MSKDRAKEARNRAREKREKEIAQLAKGDEGTKKKKKNKKRDDESQLLEDDGGATPRPDDRQLKSCSEEIQSTQPAPTEIGFPRTGQAARISTKLAAIVQAAVPHPPAAAPEGSPEKTLPPESTWGADEPKSNGWFQDTHAAPLRLSLMSGNVPPVPHRRPTLLTDDDRLKAEKTPLALGAAPLLADDGMEQPGVNTQVKRESLGQRGNEDDNKKEKNKSTRSSPFDKETLDDQRQKEKDSGQDKDREKDR